MSYILDALKKAEQERGSAQLQTVTSGRDSRIRRRDRWLPVVVAVAVCAVAFVGFLLLFPNRNRPGAAALPAAAKQSEAGAAKRQTPGSAPAAVIPPEGSMPRTADAPLSANQRIPGKSAENRNGSNARPPVSSISKPAAPAIPADNRSAADSKTEAQSSTGQAESVPAPLREAIKKMAMTVLLYSEVPAERMVYINGKRYKEGDIVEGYYHLEKITMEGAELNYKEERLLLRP